MGFEIGKNVQSGDGVTLSELKKELGDSEKLQKKAESIFNQFNTNQTANAQGQQVLDQTEQIAMMSFFKEIAGGKKGDEKDTKLGRGDLRHYKKEHKNDSAMSFVQNLGYGDMKKIMKAFNGVVGNDADNFEIESYEQTNGEVNSVTVEGKKYTIDKDNRLTDGDGVKYEYKDGKLTKMTDEHSTTEFNNGVRQKNTTTTNTVTVTDSNGKPTTYFVVDGQVTVGDKSYPVQDGKVTIEGKTYNLDNRTTTTTYQADGNTFKQTVVEDSASNTATTTNFNEQGIRTNETIENKNKNITTTNTYRPDGNTLSRSTVSDKTGNTETTTIYQANGKDYSQQVVEDKSKQPPTRTTTRYTASGNGLVSRTIKSGSGADEQTVDINYSTKQRKTTKGNVTKTEYFSNYDTTNGNIASGDVTKSVTVDKGKHTRTTEERTAGTRTVELLDDNNDKVTRTVKFDGKNKTANLTVGNKTITLNVENNNIIANSRFKGTRYETVGEMAVRLGFDKNSPGYKAIIEANGGNADKSVRNIKLPQDNLAILKGLNIDTAEVDAKAELKKHNKYQAAKAELAKINQNIANSSSRAQQLAKSLENGSGGVRQTYATAKHKVYAANNYHDMVNGRKVNHQADAGAKNWQQHYVYNPITDKMVPLEDVMDGDLKGAKVKYITENGYATLTDGRTVKISFDAFDNQMSQKVEKLKTNYNATVAELSADAAISRQNMPEMKDLDGKEIKRTGTHDYNQKVNVTTTNSYDAISDLIYSAADYNSGGDAVKLMHERITQNIDDSNVVEIYEDYKSRHTDDASMITTMTSEWLGYGKGHGRDYAVRSSKYILNRLISRAESAGVSQDDLKEAKRYADYDYNQFINNHWGHTSQSGIDGQWSYDSDLSTSFERVIDKLIPKIKSAESAQTQK